MTRQFSDEILFEKKKPKKKNGATMNINPLYIHIIIVIIIIIGLFYFFTSDINFGSDNNIEKGEVTLVGDIGDDFRKSYEGDLLIMSSKINFESENTKIEESNKDFFLKNFKGEFYLENKSIKFDGTADKVVYGKNEIKFGNDNKIKISSSEKTTIELYYDSFDLNFVEGRIKLDDALNYEFTNSSINLENYNFSLTYDGTFSFSGIAKKFSLISSLSNLNIVYDNTLEGINQS